MKLYRCDRCKADVPEADDECREWTAIHLCKVGTTTVFKNADLCDQCSIGLRHWLATGAPA